MTELVTIWNGAHHNADEDLLCVAPVAEKQVGTEEEPRPCDAIGRVRPDQRASDQCYEAVLRVLSGGGWFGVPALAEEAHVSPAAVYVVVQRLRRAGRLQRGRPVKRSQATGLVVYRLRIARPDDGETA